MKKKKGKIKILLVYTSMSSFVKKDLELLQKHFHVETIKWVGKKTLPKIVKKVLKADLTFSWFAGDHAAIAVFFSRLFFKKSIVIVGGWDVAYVPELDYGSFTLSLYKRMLTKFALKNSDKVLVVNPFLKKDAMNNANIDGNNIEYLPTGFNPSFWKSKGKKENIVLTVAGGKSLKRVKLKGVDTFVQTANFFPETKFVVVGMEGKAKAYIEKNVSKNIEIIGYLPHQKLLEYYQKAKVFCLLSLREGLPNVLCEAMLCECIPVGTSVQGITSAIGNKGFYCSYNDLDSTVDAIKKALNASEDFGKKARKRIIEFFPENKRERKIKQIIKGLVRK